MFMMIDYAREMTIKSCKYDDYGSLEHLLFLSVFCIWLFLDLFDCFRHKFGFDSKHTLVAGYVYSMALFY